MAALMPTGSLNMYLATITNCTAPNNNTFPRIHAHDPHYSDEWVALLLFHPYLWCIHLSPVQTPQHEVQAGKGGLSTILVNAAHGKDQDSTITLHSAGKVTNDNSTTNTKAALTSKNNSVHPILNCL